MTPADFGKLIKTDLHGIFLLYGDEQYLKQYYYNLAKKTVSPDGANIISLSGESVSLSELFQEITAIASIPSMDMSKRLVYVYDVEWKKVNDDHLSVLEECVNELKDYEDAVVIIDTRPEFFDAGTEKKPSKLFSKLSKIVTCINFAKETPAKIAAWVQKHFAANKINADMNICNTIVKYCGRDMTSLNNEITKLSAYILQNGRNTVELCDIHEVSSFNNEIDTFDFSNAVLNGDSERAISIMSEMILHKEAPEIIMGTIINIFTDLYTVKILDEAGYMKADIAKKTSMHEYKAGLYLQRSKALSKRGLEKALTLCREADIKIKASGLDPYETIEVVLIKLFMTGRLK